MTMHYLLLCWVGGGDSRSTRALVSVEASKSDKI